MVDTKKPAKMSSKTTVTEIRPTLDNPNNTVEIEQEKDDENPQSDNAWFDEYILDELQTPIQQPCKKLQIDPKPPQPVSSSRVYEVSFLRQDPKTGNYTVRFKGHKIQVEQKDGTKKILKEWTVKPEYLMQSMYGLKEKLNGDGTIYLPSQDERIKYRPEDLEKFLVGRNIAKNIEVIVNQK